MTKMPCCCCPSVCLNRSPYSISRRRLFLPHRGPASDPHSAFRLHMGTWGVSASPVPAMTLHAKRVDAGRTPVTETTDSIDEPEKEHGRNSWIITNICWAQKHIPVASEGSAANFYICIKKPYGWTSQKCTSPINEALKWTKIGSPGFEHSLSNYKDHPGIDRAASLHSGNASPHRLPLTGGPASGSRYIGFTPRHETSARSLPIRMRRGGIKDQSICYNYISVLRNIL